MAKRKISHVSTDDDPSKRQKLTKSAKGSAKKKSPKKEKKETTNGVTTGKVWIHFYIYLKKKERRVCLRQSVSVNQSQQLQKGFGF